MTILIACEFSGVVRDAFIERGHDAVSCDLLPSEREGPHIQGDVREWLRKRWAMVIAHPPCTYLTRVAAVWLKNDPWRFHGMIDAAVFFHECLNANAPFVAVENPRYLLRQATAMIGRPSFFVQPYEFGHPYTKKTGFWVRGDLPPLMPTAIMRVVMPWIRSSTGGPYGSKGNSKDNSRTFSGVAAAMADQWGALL